MIFLLKSYCLFLHLFDQNLWFLVPQSRYSIYRELCTLIRKLLRLSSKAFHTYFCLLVFTALGVDTSLLIIIFTIFIQFAWIKYVRILNIAYIALNQKYVMNYKCLINIYVIILINVSNLCTFKPISKEIFFEFLTNSLISIQYKKGTFFLSQKIIIIAKFKNIQSKNMDVFDYFSE